MEEGTSVDKMRPRMAPTGLSPLARLLEEQAHGEDSNSKDTDLVASKKVACRKKHNLSHHETPQTLQGKPMKLEVASASCPTVLCHQNGES